MRRPVNNSRQVNRLCLRLFQINETVIVPDRFLTTIDIHIENTRLRNIVVLIFDFISFRTLEHKPKKNWNQLIGTGYRNAALVSFNGYRWSCDR